MTIPPLNLTSHILLLKRKIIIWFLSAHEGVEIDFSCYRKFSFCREEIGPLPLMCPPNLATLHIGGKRLFVCHKSYILDRYVSQNSESTIRESVFHMQNIQP